MEESTKTLLGFLENSIREYPLSSILVLIDLNPLMIRESPEDVHFFVRGLKKMSHDGNITIYSTATENMEPVKLDLIEEGAELVMRHSVVDGAIVSLVAKSDFKVEPMTLRKELYDILVYVGRENALGRNVNISDIMANFHITAVTARKRVREMLELGFVDIEKVGRAKYIGATDKGKEFLFQHNEL
jgi:predicted transcriptional regulator